MYVARIGHDRSADSSQKYFQISFLAVKLLYHIVDDRYAERHEESRAVPEQIGKTDDECAGLILAIQKI